VVAGRSQQARKSGSPPGRIPGRTHPGVLAAIACGGALGAPARYEVAQVVHVAKDTFPWATFVTNLGGAFILGAFLTVMIERFPRTRYVRPFFAVGFLGAFTTFSTMAVETVTLMKDGKVMLGAGYLVASIAAGLVVSYAGIAIARRGLARATTTVGA
jgi:fluoride exporter